jgi:TerC family integral membrane protein
MRNHLRITHDLHGEHFLVKLNGLWHVTPLFVVLVMIEISDVIFAVDSIPAIFAVTNDPFIIFTSNIFAIMGLRAMYFLLARMNELFHLLKHGVGIILIFIGCKMLISYWYKLPISIALGVIILVLASCIIISLITKIERRDTVV